MQVDRITTGCSGTEWRGTDGNIWRWHYRKRDGAAGPQYFDTDKCRWRYFGKSEMFGPFTYLGQGHGD